MGDCRVWHITSGTPISNNHSLDRPAILQVIPRLETGGAERTTVDVAAALARAGFLPYVATEKGRMLRELGDAGGEWIPLPLHTKAPSTLLLNAFRLADSIRTRNISLIHARSRAPAWSAFMAARMTGIPFVTTYHGIYNARTSVKRFYNSVMARGDAVIANSAWTAAHIRAEYRFQPKRLIAIPRGVDFSRFDPEAIPEERVAALRRRWNVEPGQTVILLPGRLTRWKGHLVLIAALGRLKRERGLDNVRAIFAGDVQGRLGYELELRQQIAANEIEPLTHIAGHVGDMPAAYLASDIVVSASTDPEAFGRVAAEAGAMERAVIATDHGGAREVVVQNQSGLLVPPGDAAALAEALSQLLWNDTKRSTMGEFARQHVAAHFTVERMCADTIALYREFLARET